MCFSANASFAAGGVLAAVGAATIKENKFKRGLVYALIPLLFATQQIIEGFQWLSEKGGMWSQIFGYGFLFFAIVLWPVYVPIAVYLIEPRNDKKHRLGLFIFLGAVISAYSLINLILAPITISAEACCHVHYAFQMPFGLAVGGCYIVATCRSLLFSSHRWVKAMGIVAFLSLVAAFLYARATYVSVWCFFAAVLSVMVLVHARSVKHEPVV